MEVKMEPSKGRIVNYHCIKGEEYLGPDEDMILPAIITRVYRGSPMQAVDLTIFTNQPSSLMARRTSVGYGLTNGGGWSWPTLLPPVKEAIYNKDTVEQPEIATKSINNQPVTLKPPVFPPSVPAPKVG
jgi:hypothetical protein